MPPHLRVSVGPSPDQLVSISDIVNTPQKHRITTDRFDGEIVVNIKGFTGPDGVTRPSDYFARPERQGITWSIQVQGRFLVPCSADDVLFGNTFDRPLQLPWGTSAALKFMHFIDPTLEHDLLSKSKPWALSPLITTMPHFTHTRISPPNSLRAASIPEEEEINSIDIEVEEDDQSLVSVLAPEFPPAKSVTDDTSQLHMAVMPYGQGSSASGSATSINTTSSLNSSASSRRSTSSTSTSSLSSWSSSARSSATSLSLKSKSDSLDSSKLKQVAKMKRKKGHMKGKETSDEGLSQSFGLQTASQRRSYFANQANRRRVAFGPRDVITTDFCYGFLEFNPSLALRLPGGLSFDLLKYWDGQPVRFVCCERKKASTSGSGSETELNDKAESDPWGTPFWCVAIEIVDEEPRVK
ncbi:DUF1769-domain-containing protein [Pluteus cervinus]|uniref:DUF1769-domain-containing protein n=1 Tax=Pluteus cervinus TaxID=181527 RepID=A0ACD3ANV0_9AGAR|nr:DUF1769-domain-containing protein [Pluteus cervinus]